MAAWTNKGNSWHRQTRWVWVHSEIPQAEEGEHKPVRGRAHIHTTCTDKGGMDKQGGRGCRRIQRLWTSANADKQVQRQVCMNECECRHVQMNASTGMSNQCGWARGRAGMDKWEGAQAQGHTKSYQQWEGFLGQQWQQEQQQQLWQGYYGPLPCLFFPFFFSLFFKVIFTMYVQYLIQRNHGYHRYHGFCKIPCKWQVVTGITCHW